MPKNFILSLIIAYNFIGIVDKILNEVIKDMIGDEFDTFS